MNKKECYSFNDITVIAMIIIILRNLYIYFSPDIALFIGFFSDFIYFNSYIFQYIEIYYGIALIILNILLLLSKKYFSLIVKYKLKKIFVLTNLIILFFYIFKEPLFFYSTKKIILVTTFFLIEIFFTFFVHKINLKIRNWKKIVNEVFRIALISAFLYYLQYLIAMLSYLIGIVLGLGFF